MKLLPTLLVSLLTIALGFLVVMQQLRGNLDFLFGSAPMEAGQPLYRFNPAEVARIEIVNDDGTSAEVLKTSTSWKIKKPWDDFADARTVRSLIDFAARLQIEDVIARDDVEDLGNYGLKNDQIKVHLFDGAGKSLCHFAMGRYTSWFSFDPELEMRDPTQKPPSFPTLIIRPQEEGLRDHLYVCADFANPALRTVPMRDLFSGGLRLFRDHQLFHLAPTTASRITLREKGSEITLKRDSPSKDSEWTIEKPYQLATSEKAMSRLIQGLSALQAGAVVNEEDLALPPPLPENVAFSIGIEYFQKDGTSGQATTALFYPPENQEAKVSPVVISQEKGQTRPAVLLVPRGPGSLLATLPRDVNSLRSRTLTAMRVRDVKSVSLRDFTDRAVDLTLETDPHERAARWYARVTRREGPDQISEAYDGPANSKQVFEFFEALFKNEVVSFTNDAATSPEDYGLDRPIRRIIITPKKGKPVTYLIGEKLSPKYYARRFPNGRVIQISEEAWEAAEKGRDHPELKAVASPTTDAQGPPGGLELFGLDQPKVIQVSDAILHLGKADSRLFFGNRLDSDGKPAPHVVEIAPDQLGLMPMQAFHWRGERLWNINRFEINGLRIKKRGQPALELTYDFYAPKPWSATRGGAEVTALLNTNKAEKLLEKLTDIEVQQWIGPVAGNAEARLTDPSLTISLRIEEISDEGRNVGIITRNLSLSEVIDSPANRFFFGKSNSQPDFFLLDAATHERLSVDLLVK